jgi:hypothetical protein
MATAVDLLAAAVRALGRDLHGAGDGSETRELAGQASAAATRLLQGRRDLASNIIVAQGSRDRRRPPSRVGHGHEYLPQRARAAPTAGRPGKLTRRRAMFNRCLTPAISIAAAYPVGGQRSARRLRDDRVETATCADWLLSEAMPRA